MSSQKKHWPLNAKLNAEITRKHRDWPIGTTVSTLTPQGYLSGHVSKHWRKSEYPHGCSIDFGQIVDMGDANSPRYCHVIPFRNLRKIVSKIEENND